MIHAFLPFMFQKSATKLSHKLNKILGRQKLPSPLPVIKMLILDVDGTLTDGKVLYPNRAVTFSTYDGYGIMQLSSQGIQIGIITGRPETEAVTDRMMHLKIPYTVYDCLDKNRGLAEICNKAHIKPEEIAYMGDDLPDIIIMDRVSLSFAPANAHKKVKQRAHYVTQLSGGNGAIREVADILLDL
jgi:3-deoxy-D-manno-octulosonate 8-phosphate phosphatase (KDO 8-P phosphatase)